MALIKPSESLPSVTPSWPTAAVASTASGHVPPGGGTYDAFPRWGWAAVAALVVAWVLAWTRFAWFAPLQRYTFVPLWLSAIGVLSALTQRRAGTCLLTRRPGFFAGLFAASTLFWWFFEYLNRFCQNWYYRGAEGMSGAQYALVASASFATVLPAVLAAAEWLGTFPRLQQALLFGQAHRGRSFAPAASAWATLACGGAGLAWLGVYPDLFFPLLWLAPLAMSVAAQVLLGRPTVFDGVRRGDWRGPATFALAGLLCGGLWEMWNFWSLARWEYSVPFVQRFLVFEMPVLGYAGYLPFGCECAAAALWVEALWPNTEHGMRTGDGT